MTTDTPLTSRFVRAARRRRAVLPLAAVLLAAALAGCSASDSGGSSFEPAAGEAAGDAMADEAAAQAGGTDADRQVVTTGELYLAVDDPVAAATRVATLVGDLGGRVEQREQAAGGDGYAGSASMTVRVPAAELDRAVAAFGELGEVRRYTESTQDVTDTAVDLDARIEALEISVARVQEFLDRAANTTELLATEQELSQRQAELESLRAQRAALADQVAMSTLYVSLTVPGDAVIERPGPRTFVDGLDVGWQSLWRTLRAMTVVVGVLLPWLVPAAVVAVGVGWLVRRRRTPPGPPAPPLVAPQTPVPPPAPDPVGAPPPR